MIRFTAFKTSAKNVHKYPSRCLTRFFSVPDPENNSLEKTQAPSQNLNSKVRLEHLTLRP
jgi:hypothetical protein